MPAFELPELVQRRAEKLGPRGLAWLDGLDGTTTALAGEWDIELGEIRSGGSEALVIDATLPDGRLGVLKIGLPGSESGRREAQVLNAAGGRGYARLFSHDESRQAMLMERLGTPLSEMGWTVRERIVAICTVLQEAWRTPLPEVRLMTGAEKAADLVAFIERLWHELDRPCSERVIDRARQFAVRRRDAFDPREAVLGHGDGHSANTLLVPGSDPPAFKFIDPDGLFIERAYDLGVLMRDWPDDLLAGDPLTLGRERAKLLCELTGVPVQPLWEWGFIERVSTGLHLKQLGLDEAAGQFLAVAEHWAAE